MTNREILIAARALISDYNRWCKGWSAKTAKNQLCGPDDENAVTWCAGGAIVKCAPAIDRVQPVWDILREHIPGNKITAWNDRTTHAEVLAGFDRAIAHA